MANQSRSFDVQMKAVLDEFSNEVVEALESSATSVSKEVVKKLKETSPKRPGHGEYARSWTTEKTGKRSRGLFLSGIGITVYNRDHYRLTHLLEFGHVTRNKKGTYGRTPAHPHIGAVEEWAVEELPKRFEKEIQK